MFQSNQHKIYECKAIFNTCFVMRNEYYITIKFFRAYSAGPKSCYPPSIKVTFSELCSANYVKDRNLFFLQQITYFLKKYKKIKN